MWSTPVVKVRSAAMARQSRPDSMIVPGDGVDGRVVVRRHRESINRQPARNHQYRERDALALSSQAWFGYPTQRCAMHTTLRGKQPHQPERLAKLLRQPPSPTHTEAFAAW